MKRRSRDEEREQRITMEIVVDAYTPEEQAMGWYSSLEDRRHFPFVARCIAQRSISPLRVGDQVEVVGMAPEAECQHEMFVLIGWERRPLAVPLAQLEGVAVDDQTRQVIEDWQYWVAQGYDLLSNADLKGCTTVRRPRRFSGSPLPHGRALPRRKPDAGLAGRPLRRRGGVRISTYFRTL
jgi:Calcium binding